MACDNKRGALYWLSWQTSLGKFIVAAEANDGIKLWNKMFGHMSQKGLDILFSSHKLVIKGIELDFCNNCIYDKQLRSSYYPSHSCKLAPLELINSRVCLCLWRKSLGKSLQLITFMAITLERAWYICTPKVSEAVINFIPPGSSLTEDRGWRDSHSNRA